MVFRRAAILSVSLAHVRPFALSARAVFILRYELAEWLKNLFRIGALCYVYRINILPVDLIGSFSP